MQPLFREKWEECDHHQKKNFNNIHLFLYLCTQLAIKFVLDLLPFAEIDIKINLFVEAINQLLYNA